LKPYADRARKLTRQIKVALHYTITEGMSDTQTIHQLLSQLGIKLMMNWSRSHPGYRGEKLRLYSLDIAHWEQIWVNFATAVDEMGAVTEPSIGYGRRG
jgi:hypothetical protein